jgi:D-proline reductase (dithiol) PrdB
MDAIMAGMTQLDATVGLPEPHPYQPVRYIDRTRAWYGALGYDPYRWPCYTDVPFEPLSKPLAESRVALITTAAPFRPELGDQGPGAEYNGAAKFFDVFTRPMDATSDDDHDLRISHIGYDRNHSQADDRNTWLPIERLGEAVEAGRVGGLTDRIYSVPTVRRQRSTIEEHAPQVTKLVKGDRADVALLVPT